MYSVVYLSCDQAAPRMVQSVRLYVLSVRHTLSQRSHHRIIMKFQGVITNDKIDVHVKGDAQRSKV